MKTKLFVILLILGLVTIAAAQPGRDVTWTQKQDALYPFSDAGSGVLGNYFYCLGGNSANLSQAFNLSTEQWEQSTSPLYGGEALTGVATDSAIYIICRWISGSGSSNEVQKFTPIGGGPTGIWTPMAPHPLITCQQAVAWDGGNFIYAAGGDGAGNWSAYKYDIAANLWIAIADLPMWRNCSGGAFVLGKFYVVGGWPENSATLEYDPATNTWTEGAGMPVWVSNVSWCTTSNDSLVFVPGGGGYPGWPITNEAQVYNPLTDTWTLETPLPALQGYNVADFIPPDKVISAGGWQQSTGYLDVTYLGTGFPTSGPTYNLSVDLIPFVQPIQIPASGGTFSFYAFVTNNGTSSHDVQLWTKIIDPTSYTIQPILGPAMVTLPPGTRGWVRHQNIPGEWISGVYTYVACAGFYPSSILASDSLQFTKLTTGDGPWVSDWACTGEEIDPAVWAYSVRSSGSGATPTMEVLPNPFNPTTAISYELRDASFVSLNIYDTAGRLVTELVNGWRQAGTHQITFDGSGLPSGIYFAKLTAGDASQVQKLVLMK